MFLNTNNYKVLLESVTHVETGWAHSHKQSKLKTIGKQILFFKVCSALRTYLMLRLKYWLFCLCVIFSLENVGPFLLSCPFAKKKEADFQWRFCFLFIQLITPSRWMCWSSWRCWTCGTAGWFIHRSSLSFFLQVGFLPALPLASLRNILCLLTANHYPL